MNHRLPSLVATALIQAALGYALVSGLAMLVQQQPRDRLSTLEFRPERKPVLPPRMPPVFRAAPARPAAPSLPGAPVVLHDWSVASPEQRDRDFMAAHQWVKDNMPEEERRLIRWREELPQGTGPARVSRLRPANLPTHTLYWPPNWSKGPLPIIAWGNGFGGLCSNSSLPYAAFLSEIASHGYFVVAVGNDDIDYPQPEGLEVLADGRPVRTRASALRQAVDWAIAENGRAGGPYGGKLDPAKIAYMGHDCGGEQALAASSDPRTTTTVLLNAAARFRPDATDNHRQAIVRFEGVQDDEGVLGAGNDSFARAQAAGRPMFKAALAGVGHAGAYAAPNRRWSKAVIAWLDWQLKGEGSAAAIADGLSRNGWSRIASNALP